ncbi:inositol-trisphosphate 3-kinase B [Esox lucius]|uniref:Kinase n=1 Tax=Esox lucius TaxID=8010 RepID=A0A6Q2ZNE0_ESOLU|nr:inositol-trisphosphate 3-kinase B [Esox lucius]
MDKTPAPALNETRDVEDNKILVGQLENIEHDDGFVALLNDIEHLSVSDRIPSVCSGVKPKPKWSSSREFRSNSQQLPVNNGPAETYRQVEDKEPGSDLHTTRSLSVDTDKCSYNGEREETREEEQAEEAEGSGREKAPTMIRSRKERWRIKDRKRQRLEGNLAAETTEGLPKMERIERRSMTGRIEEEEEKPDGQTLNEGSGERKRSGQAMDGEIDREDTEDREMGGQHAGDGVNCEKESASSPEGICEGLWSPSPHPILSRMLLHSSVSSTSSSNFSSADSDEVFSEGEATASRRNTMKRCRSWRTFLTIMQWSLRRQSSWVQLAGHQGNFQLSDGGEVLKRFSEVEAVCLQALMDDPLRPFVPQYYGSVTRGGHSYIRLKDLLSGLKNPVIMDCKMGVRTYQEEELTKAQTKPILRTDMYLKMVEVDPTAPTVEENEQQGVTKWRYMQWRDSNSSSSTFGFRIEGIMMDNGSVQRDFKKTLTNVQVTEALLCFTKSQLPILEAYHYRLQALGEALKESPFFKTHEVIGSSLLFIHDRTCKANIWMIDFGKTTPVPRGMELRHNVPWALGNREDGYLTGLATLTSFVGQAIDQVACRQEKNNEMETTNTNILQEQKEIESQAGQDEQAKAIGDVTRETTSEQCSLECVH